ncbi:MAG TPA: hypothetical protein P5550_00325 [Bacteroidales bacterium]|nr:hypothetical protein [Bacteroidales bacterium]
MMKYPARKDPYTGEMFVPGRRNQRFASKETKNAWHNQRAIALADEKRAVNKVLEKNRKILASLLGDQASVETTLLDLERQGFRFNYLTHTRRHEEKVWRYIYGIRYLIEGKSKIIIEKTHA